MSTLPHLRKIDVEEALFDGAFHVLESLETVRSCCILAEMANDGFAAHAEDADAQILRLFNGLFDILRCVFTGCRHPR